MHICINDNDAMLTTQIDREGMIWLQRPGEPTTHFQWFEYFRKAGPDRSIRAAYLDALADRIGREAIEQRMQEYEHALNSASPAWYSAAKRWRWEERALAWDRHRNRLNAQAEDEEIELCRKMRREALYALLKRGVEALGRVDLDQANISQAAAAIKAAVRELRAELGDDGRGEGMMEEVLMVLPREIRQPLLIAIRRSIQAPSDDANAACE